MVAEWDQDLGRSIHSPSGLGREPTTHSVNPATWTNMGVLSHPYAEVSTALGVHLHPAMKKKWRGKYVDLFSLLFCPALCVGQWHISWKDINAPR